MVGKSRVQDFFRLPLGMINAVEAKTYDDNKIKHNYIEIIAKDNRRMNFVMRNFDECQQLKNLIRHLTFLDEVQPIER